MFFLGYRKTHKLHQALEMSYLFQQEQLTGKACLKSIRLQGTDYIGLSLTPFLSYAALIQAKQSLDETLYSYCPQLSILDPELLFEIFSPSV